MNKCTPKKILLLLPGLILVSAVSFGQDHQAGSGVEVQINATVHDSLTHYYDNSPVIFSGNNAEDWQQSVKMTIIRSGASPYPGGQKPFNLLVTSADGSDQHFFLSEGEERVALNVHFRNWGTPETEDKPYKQGVLEYGKEVKGLKTGFRSGLEANNENLEMKLVIPDRQVIPKSLINYEAVLNVLLTAL